MRVYAAWVSEADQRASTGLLARLPQRPTATPGSSDSAERLARNPYELAAADLRAQILSGSLRVGSLLPSRKELATTYNIAVGTAHRAVVLLGEWGLIDIRRGHRAVVLNHAATPEEPGPPVEAVTGAEGAPSPGAADAAEPESQRLVELVLRRRGSEIGRLTAGVTCLSAGVLRQLLADAIRRAGQDESAIGEYEMDVRHVDAPEVIMTFVTPF